jgi:signal transduction histidine kinase
MMAQQSRLFRKYAIYIVSAVCVVLLAGASSDIYFTSQALRAQLAELQQVNAVSAAEKIERFLADIEQQSSGIRTLPVDYDVAALRHEAQRLLRQAPAVTNVTVIDASGKELLFASRFELDRIGGDRDLAGEDGFRLAKSGQTYYSPVYFRKETEPYMTVALPQAWQGGGVTMIEVNLKAVWEVISPIRIGKTGFAYAVDRSGSLIAHPDISLVLANLNMLSAPQVAAALSASTRQSARAPNGGTTSIVDIGGSRVLSTFVRLPALDWFVFVQQPLAEVDAPVYAAITRTIVLLIAGLFLAFAMAVTLARRLVTPIEAIRRGAEQLASGVLDYRIDVRSGDELEAVANQFNNMAARLQESHESLERKVEERTRELEGANQAQKRFLAIASHDLRQPVYALRLLISGLRGKDDLGEIRAIVARAEATIEIAAELLDNLLDISKLDVGVVQPKFTDFKIGPLLERIAFDFAPEAEDKGVILRVEPSSALIRSDPIMLGRILVNLVSNALRSTSRGRILVGCRRTKDHIRIEVWDTGVGIAPDHQLAIFQEFFRVPDGAQSGSSGLGLGLSIVNRLAELLGCAIEVSSVLGKGSRFAVVAPIGAKETEGVGRGSSARSIGASLLGRSVLVINGDVEALGAVEALLADWGCKVTTAQTGGQAARCLARLSPPAEIIICDHDLAGPDAGAEVLTRLIAGLPHPVAAILMTSDADTSALRPSGPLRYPILHKPLRPAKLRSLMTHLLARGGDAAGDG